MNDDRHYLSEVNVFNLVKLQTWRKQIFEIWSRNEQLPFKFESTKKVEVQDLYGKNNYFLT